MLEHDIKQLEYIVDSVPPILRKFSEADLSFKPAPDKWSKKEIIGHLIDSATNNHQRFVRCQFEESPEIAYDQNKWCEFSYHQQMDGSQLIAFWALYNKRLIEIIKRIPENKLSNRVKIGEQLLTLESVIVDYVKHINHHIEQLIDWLQAASEKFGNKRTRFHPKKAQAIVIERLGHSPPEKVRKRGQE